MPPGLYRGGGYETQGDQISPLIMGPTTSIAGNYQALPSDHFIRVNAGPADITLASASLGTASSGQRLAVVNFDTGGNLVRLVPKAGDDIEGGANFPMSMYAAHCEIEARVAGGVTHWLFVSRDTVTSYIFPVQPTLAAGAQGPIPLGAIFIPQGVRGLRFIGASCDQVLTGGTLTVSIGAVGLASVKTINIASGVQQGASLFPPGNVSTLTVPQVAGGGAYITASVSTTAGFGGATTVAVYLDTH